jgi:hypothetical protein
LSALTWAPIDRVQRALNKPASNGVACESRPSYFVSPVESDSGDFRGDCVAGSTRVDQTRCGGSIPTSPLSFKLGDRHAARELILNFHYTARCKSGGVMIGTFHRPDLDGLCVAACVFHTPPAPWSEPVLELHRLVRRPTHQVPLTRLVAWTCRAILKAGVADLLVSYADSTQGHHGGVYQACGWHYHGKRPAKLDGYFTPEGEYVPARSACKRFGCNRRRELAARGITAHFDKGKHLYWRALTPAGEAQAERLGFVRAPYPKPSPFIAHDRASKRR